MPDEISIELSYLQLRDVILAHGFTMQKEETHKSTYTNNKLGLMQVVYDSLFFVAVKSK
jgi:hypothetical protein